jgi:hypothetical protein
MYFMLILVSVHALAVDKISNSHTSLPLLFNTGNPEPYGLPSAIIEIQGKIIPIIFDSGASKSEITLSEYALKNLKVNFTGNQVCTTALDGRHCEEEFIIPEVKIGTFVLKNVKGTLMSELWGGDDKSFIPTEASRNGVIGYDLLEKFNVLLDYPHQQAILFQKGIRPTQYDFSQWIALPFTDQLYTKVLINGKKMTLGWDTGSVPSIIKASAVLNLAKSACERDTPYGRNKSCNRIVTETFETFPDKSKLPETWFRVRNIPAEAPFDGLMGSNFFMDNLVYFDFDNHKILIKP